MNNNELCNLITERLGDQVTMVAISRDTYNILKGSLILGVVNLSDQEKVEETINNIANKIADDQQLLLG